MLKGNYIVEAIEAGCDEAGRGCLAGPVYAAAVIFPPGYRNSELDDSKKLNEKKRIELSHIIVQDALTYGVGIVDNKEIDEINILQASFLAMHRAIDELKVEPEHLIIDGNKFNKYKCIPHVCIVKGDTKYQSIAAASILAKTFRDEYMRTLHLHHPDYKWDSNVGYPTQAHKKAISILGITPYHRKSFNLKNQIKINF